MICPVSFVLLPLVVVARRQDYALKLAVTLAGACRLGDSNLRHHAWLLEVTSTEGGGQAQSVRVNTLRMVTIPPGSGVRGVSLCSNFGRGGGDETPLQGFGGWGAGDPGRRSPAGSLAPGYDASALQAGFPGHANLRIGTAAAVPNAGTMILAPA